MMWFNVACFVMWFLMFSLQVATRRRLERCNLQRIKWRGVALQLQRDAPSAIHSLHPEDVVCEQNRDDYIERLKQDDAQI